MNLQSFATGGLQFLIAALSVYLAASTGYLLALALAYRIVREPKKRVAGKTYTFAVLVPAHDEELLISGLCENLHALDYPQDHYRIFIIADNCTDRTADICRAHAVNLLVRQDGLRTGKGHALAWALRQIALDSFDAVFVIDADTLADKQVLTELGMLLDLGEQAIQCCNSIGNRDESWFTRMLFVSRTINNLLYHHAKYKLGLSSHLMGTGMCFTTALLKKKGWTAFTIGEDWEYSAHLSEDGVRIAFARDAVVRHQESRSLSQATSQRLRWSRGRFYVSARFGARLFLRGLSRKDPILLDASLPLIFPNYSLLANLTCLTLILCLLLPPGAFRLPALALILGLMGGQVALFMTGVYLAGSWAATLKALLYTPLFLSWKLLIDFLSVTGIYNGKTWARTKRYGVQTVMGSPLDRGQLPAELQEWKAGEEVVLCQGVTPTRNKINLLFVLLQMATGGAEKVALTIAEHLDRSAFRIHVACFEGGALRDRFSDVSEALFQVPRRNGLDPRTVLLLSRIIRENHIDVINCHHYAAFFYTWLAARLARAGTIVYTEHSAGEAEDIRHIHKVLCNSVFFKNTGAIVGVSQEIGDVFNARFPDHEKLVTSILNGIDVQKFATATGRDRVRNAFGFAPDDFVLGTIANFRRVKNHLCLLRAFALTSAAHPGTRLVFVGRGYAGDGENSEKDVRDYVHAHGLEDRVLFAGYRDDIAEILKSFDLFCLPSLSEGLPVSVLEAMAAGVPVVGSDVRGIREVVRHGGTGLLFPSNDEASLARAIESLMEDGRARRRLTEEAFSYVRLEHDLRPWIARYQDLFQRCFQGHGPRNRGCRQGLNRQHCDLTNESQPLTLSV